MEALVRPAHVATRERGPSAPIEVAGAEGLAVAVDEGAFGCGRDALYGVLPVEADAEAGGAVEEYLMEDGAADAASGSLRKGGFRGGGGVIGGGGFADEADAAQEMVFGFAQNLVEISEADGCEGLE